MKLHQYFLPHPQTHQKSPFLSWHFLLIYILLFILVKVSMNLVSLYRPGVLGVSSQGITVTSIIDNTNAQRAKLGLTPLKENAGLSDAAYAKAQNMFAENYWAHFSPSGRDPWGFILSAGYRFSYAGENLARNFTSADEVVNAWMNSPTHRENLLNSKYQDIGVAVVDGVLQGQRTTLVVQEFGAPYRAVAELPPQINVGGQKLPVNIDTTAQVPLAVAGISEKPQQDALINPYWVSKIAGIILVSFIGLLLIVDVLTLKKRGVFRFSSYYLAHLGLLALTITALVVIKAGNIL